ncbi:MAG TPA: HD-GYP domain-containing protein, partial [Clostridia bacterium]|nr:HD-GYP domain-containing protein [Clostridia bacterium]
VKLSKAIGKKLKLSDDNIFELELATTLHDIGKMSIDQQILMKPGKLTEEEWGEIKKHPETGYRIAQSTSELMSISEYILSHHERWDGKGYPQGLKGEEIPLIARIINVVDSYDAMTSKRTYGKELNKEEAIIEMRNCAGTQFDPELIEIFIEEVLTEL